MPIFINDEKVEDSTIQTEFLRLSQTAQPGDDSQQENMHDQAMNNIIHRTLLKQEATKRDAKIAKEAIKKGVEELFAEYEGKESFLERTGMQEKDLPKVSEHVEDNLRIEELFAYVCREIKKPTVEDAEKYYLDNVHQFMLAPEVHACHIVKQVRGESEEIFQQMLKIRKRLKKGEDFAKIANENSDCSQEPGGDLGFFAKGHMVEEFDAVLFSLDIDEISPVFLTQFGYHIAKVIARKEARQQSFAEVKTDVIDFLYEQLQDNKVQEYVEQLREKAKIVEVDPEQPNNNK